MLTGSPKRKGMMKVWSGSEVPGIACGRDGLKARNVVGEASDYNLQDVLWEIYCSLVYNSATQSLRLARSGLGLKQNCVCEGFYPYVQMVWSGLPLQLKSFNVLTSPGR